MVLVLMWVAAATRASGQVDDYGTWLSVDLSKDITSKFSLGLEEEVRLFKNFSELDRFSTSLTGEYSFIKALKAGAGYMLIFNHKVNSDTWDTRHRYFVYVQGRQEIGRFTLSLRERFQSTFVKEEAADEDGFDLVNKNYLRSRLSVSYDIKNNKLEPYASAEMYYSLHKSGGNEINDMRYTVGAEFPISGKLDLDTYLRLDQEMNVKNPVSMYVAGVSLKVKL